MINENGLFSKCFREKKTMVALSLVMCLLFGTLVYSQSYQETLNLQRKQTYGFHNGAIYGTTHQSINSIINHKSIISYGAMTIHGRILDNSSCTIGSVGTVDSNFLALESIAFLEGDFPNEKNEIALESYILDQLNIPYQIGTTITLDILLANENVIRQTFFLCGIINTYSTNWKTNGHPICNAFLSSCDYPTEEYHLFFYGEYDTNEQMEELKVLTNGDLVFNDYSFPLRNDSVIDLITNRMIVVIVALIGLLFLTSIKISSYKKHLYRLRVLLALGADRKELYRSLYFTAIKDWSCIFLACSGLYTLIILGANCLLTVNYPLRLSLATYVISGVCSFFSVVTAQTVQISLLSKTSMIPKGIEILQDTQNNKGISATINNEFALIKCELHRNKKHFLIENSLIILSFSILFFCLYALCDSQQIYTKTALLNAHDYYWESASTSYGLAYSDILKIQNTANIEDVAYTSSAFSIDNEPIYITYSNHEVDEYVSCVNTFYDQANTSYGMRTHIVLVPQGSLLWNYYMPNDIDTDSFLAGNSVILYLPEIAELTNRSYAAINTFDINTNPSSVNTYYPGVEIGDQITITAGNIRKTVSCLDIMQRFPSYQQTSLDFLIPGSVLISESLYFELFSVDSILYTDVYAFGNNSLSYDVGDKLMSSITTNKNISFTNNRIAKETAKKGLLTDCIFIGSIVLFICIITIIITFRNRQYLYTYENDRILLLRKLGCQLSVIKKMYQTKTVFFIIPYALILNSTVLLLFAYRNYIDFVSADNILSTLLKICSFAFYKFPWTLLVLPQIVFLVFLIGFTRWFPSYRTC